MSMSPSIPGQTSLIPVNDCVLVKLDPTSIKETKYSTRTSGIVFNTDVPKEPIFHDGEINERKEYDPWLGKRVYFEEYKEGSRIKRDGELFCFIKIADIRGFEEVND